MFAGKKKSGLIKKKICTTDRKNCRKIKRYEELKHDHGTGTL